MVLQRTVPTPEGAEVDDGWPREVSLPPAQAELWQEDEPLESDAHVDQMVVMRDSLRFHYRDRADVFVGANMPVYFSALQVRKRDFRAPDLFVVLGARPGERDFWVVWEEEGRTPDLVVEVLSESTEATDRGRKKDLYERVLKVTEYFLYDLRSGHTDGYRLTNGAYEPIAPGPSGRLSSQVLGLEVGALDALVDQRAGHWLRFFLPDGRVLPTAAEAEAQRADSEAHRAEAEAQRAEAEAQRAEAEAHRADSAAQRADSAEAREQALAAKLAALEARLAALDEQI